MERIHHFFCLSESLGHRHPSTATAAAINQHFRLFHFDFILFRFFFDFFLLILQLRIARSRSSHATTLVRISISHRCENEMKMFSNRISLLAADRCRFEFVWKLGFWSIADERSYLVVLDFLRCEITAFSIVTGLWDVERRGMTQHAKRKTGRSTRSDLNSRIVRVTRPSQSCPNRLHAKGTLRCKSIMPKCQQ